MLPSSNILDIYRKGDFCSLSKIQKSNTHSFDDLILLARTRMDQGELQHAHDLLERAFRLAETDNERLSLKLQLLAIRGQQSGEIQKMLDEAIQLVDVLHINDPKIAAHFERLNLMAEKCFIRPKGDTAERLMRLRDALLDLAPIDAVNIGSWCVFAESDLRQRYEKAEEFEKIAFRAGFPHRAADVWLALSADARRAIVPKETHLAWLGRAERAFARANYIPGAAYVKTERLWRMLLESSERPDKLVAMLPVLDDLQATRAEYFLLTNLATEFSERGQLNIARDYREQAKHVADRAKLGSLFLANDLSELEQIRGEGRPVEAIKLCDEKLLGKLNDVERGVILQSRARAAFDAGSREIALKDASDALHLFLSIGASPQISDLVAELATYQISILSKPELNATDELVVEAQNLDFQSGRVRGGLLKSQLRCHLALQAFDRFRTPDWLEKADELLSASLLLARSYPKLVKDVHRLGCLQIESHIAAARNDRDRFLKTNSEAIALALETGRGSIAAGCAMMCGVVEYNMMRDAYISKQQDARREHSQRAYDMLENAAKWYHNSNQSMMVVRAKSYLAEIAADSALQPALGLESGLLELASSYLSEADQAFEERRHELRLGSELQTLKARQELAKQSERLLSLALRVYSTQARDEVSFWEWLQKSKARSLTDTLANQVDRSIPISLSDAEKIIGYDEPRATLVDWCVVAGRVYLCVCRVGTHPIVKEISISAEDLDARIRSVAERQFGATLADAPHLLRMFDVLVEPLGTLTKENDLLALSPMASIGLLPLHALMVDGRYLIERNRLITVPNHAFGLAEWTGEVASEQAVVYGDPTSDLESATDISRKIGHMLRTVPVLGKDVTPSHMHKAICEAHLIHYQGHAIHMPDNPLLSAFDLASGPLTASDILSVKRSSVKLMVLSACESGVAKMERGNEPNGLTQALLLRGVGRVISTLWSIEERSSSTFFEAFYEMRKSTSDIDAYRTAMLTSLETFGGDRPHLWAPFTLAGRLFLEDQK